MIKHFGEILNIDKKEIARYLGYGKNLPDEVVERLIDQKTSELKTDGKVCYLPLSVLENNGEKIDFGFFSVKSKDLAKYIGNAKEVILFGATIGIEFDRLLKRETVLSPSGAAVLQAVGACAIETLCDCFCAEFKAKTRFSPGYGDLSISVQEEVFKILALEKNIGVTLTQSFLMTPTKSVTAFFVPGNEKCEACENCDKKETCTFRKA